MKMLVVLLALSANALASPIEVKGKVADERFLTVCEEAATKAKVTHWSGTFSVIDSGRKSPFTIDHPAMGGAPEGKADRRSISLLVKQGFGLKSDKGERQEVAWFAYETKQGLELLINTPLGQYERNLLGQVREAGQDWAAMAIYFAGGNGSQNDSWLSTDSIQYTWISCGETKLETLLAGLSELGITK